MADHVSPEMKRTQAWQIAIVCLGLAALVWLVFGQTLGFAFVNFDDGSYVYRNPEVTRGITVEGIRWAFTHVVVSNWHPLTMLSFMLDCSIWGVSTTALHATNVGLHAVATILLFIVFRSMTGELWRSAFIAAVFGIHPLHVESVAWIAERKDVLSAVFFLLTIGAYVHYARRPNMLRYLGVMTCYALGLLSKPMIVTLPFVLMLLDYWPLKRSANVTLTKLIAEKVPLFLFTLVISVTTLISQRETIRAFSIEARLANAILSLITYVCQSFWPLDLAVFYPHSESSILDWRVFVSLVFFIIAAVGLWVSRKRAPYLVVGSLWYLGMVVPVIGIVQVGLQAHADRYMYLPQIGLTIIVAWGLPTLLSQRRYREFILSSAAVAALTLLTLNARAQVFHWRNSESLWTHAVAVTASNELAHEHLSQALLQTGRVDEALDQARQALANRANSADALGTMGAALVRKGDFDEAMRYLNSALRIDPQLRQAHYNLGNVFLQKGKLDEAIAEYDAELKIGRDFPEIHNNLGRALLQQGKLEEARSHIAKALVLGPNNPEARNNLAIILSQKGEIKEAIEEWNKTVKIQPTNLEAQCNLAWIYATFPKGEIRDGSKAVHFAEQALQLSGRRNPRVWRLAAAAYAEAGRFEDAITAAQNGISLARSLGNRSMEETLEENIKLFERHVPLRDVSAGDVR